jgi:hypothetical protein
MPKSKQPKAALPALATEEPSIPIPDNSTVALAAHLAHVVREELGVEGFSPFEVLALIAANPLNDVNVRLKAASNLAMYYRPQVKAIAVESHQVSEHHIIFDE